MYLSSDLGSARRLQVSARSGSPTPDKCLMFFKGAAKGRGISALMVSKSFRPLFSLGPNARAS